MKFKTSTVLQPKGTIINILLSSLQMFYMNLFYVYFLKNKRDKHHLIDLGNNLVIYFQPNL